jgi:hypothetical protein
MASIIIKVPDPEKGSFNHNRPAGKLLQSQTLHLRQALLRHLKDIEDVLAINPESLRTERDVSSYVQKVTAILHKQGRNSWETSVK